MKKITVLLTIIFTAFIITACTKEQPVEPVIKPNDAAVTDKPVSSPDGAIATDKPVSSPDGAIATDKPVINPDDAAVTDKPVSNPDDATVTGEPYSNTIIDNTDTVTVTPEPTPEVKAAPSNDELCTAYTQVLNDLAHENELADEIVFATLDVNNDGVRELIFSESNVHAAGAYICYYDDGKVYTAGPFGSYGGMKYIPEDGLIISAIDNMECITYEVSRVDEKYDVKTVDRFSIEPGQTDDSYVYFHNDAELTHDDFAKEFATLQSAEARSIGYYDMYWYCWCSNEYDPLFERLNTMLESEEYGRSCNLIIPADEKAKLIGTWTVFSHEFDGDVRFASDGNLEGKVVIDENYRVTLYDSDTEILHKDMDIFFVNEAYSDYMENTDWYVWLSGDNMDGDEFYMNVTPDGQLCMNFINTTNDEYYISAWSYYDRVTE